MNEPSRAVVVAELPVASIHSLGCTVSGCIVDPNVNILLVFRWFNQAKGQFTFSYDQLPRVLPRFICCDKRQKQYTLYAEGNVFVDMSMQMLKGLLKMSMLKIISENRATGYEIIKKVNELTGKKPSTGSVYPILRSMANKGLIIGRTQSGKTFYEITDLGHRVLEAHGSMKNYYEQKISSTINLAKGTFNDLHVTLVDDKTFINQVANEVSSCMAHGVAPEKINSVLSKTLAALRKLE